MNCTRKLWICEREFKKNLDFAVFLWKSAKNLNIELCSKNGAPLKWRPCSQNWENLKHLQVHPVLLLPQLPQALQLLAVLMVPGYPQIPSALQALNQLEMQHQSMDKDTQTLLHRSGVEYFVKAVREGSK